MSPNWIIVGNNPIRIIDKIIFCKFDQIAEFVDRTKVIERGEIT